LRKIGIENVVSLQARSYEQAPIVTSEPDEGKIDI
jgi:hypothetical protein